MAEDSKNSPFGHNWKHFEELFNGITNMQQGKIQDLAWVDKFIQNVMKTAVPDAVAKNGKPQTQTLETEVFETHRNVILKIRVPSHVEPRSLQLFANSQQVKIEGPGSNVQYVRLPSTVISNSSKAEFRNGILQLQLRKKGQSDRYDELDIRYL